MRNSLFHRILKLGLSYPTPLRPRNPSGDPDIELECKLYDLYETGQVTASEHYHLKDREYEQIQGMQSTRRVGKMTEEVADVIEAFVEEEPGEREARLKEQIEKDFGEIDGFEDGGITGRDGKLVMLHHMDRRAVEFRERMRTWCVNSNRSHPG